MILDLAEHRSGTDLRPRRSATRPQPPSSTDKRATRLVNGPSASSQAWLRATHSNTESWNVSTKCRYFE